MADYDGLADFYFKRRNDKARFDYNRDIEVPALLSMIGDATDKVILDMGCGFGDHASKLQGFKSLIGFDLSQELVSLAKNQNIPNTAFYVGDMSNALRHERSSFDIVYSSLAIHYIKNIGALFGEVHRVLKPNGIFCFSTGHPIFNLMNQSDKHVIGKIDGRIHGDYFDESCKENDLGGLGKVKMYNFTFETWIRSGLDKGFSLVGYTDAKPLLQSKEYDSEKYLFTLTLPTFVLFKFRK